jgi:hypothetical protein
MVWRRLFSPPLPRNCHNRFLGLIATKPVTGKSDGKNSLRRDTSLSRRDLLARDPCQRPLGGDLVAVTFLSFTLRPKYANGHSRVVLSPTELYA